MGAGKNKKTQANGGFEKFKTKKVNKKFKHKRDDNKPWKRE